MSALFRSAGDMTEVVPGRFDAATDDLQQTPIPDLFRPVGDSAKVRPRDRAYRNPVDSQRVKAIPCSSGWRFDGLLPERGVYGVG